MAADTKLGSIELKGARLYSSPDEPEVAIDGNHYSREKAGEADRSGRDKLYNTTRSLMLVHRIRPSEKTGQEFDTSTLGPQRIER